MKRYLEYLNENKEADSLLIRAIHIGDLDNAKKAINNGANINIDKFPDKMSALLNCIYIGRFDIAEILIELGADINKPDKNGWTPLILSAYLNELYMFKKLFYNGANPETKNSYGKTFMSYCHGDDIEPYIKSYQFQKDFLNRYPHLVKMIPNYYLNPDIKKEYSELFKATDWGLI